MQRLILILALASGILALNYVNNHLKKNITHAKVHEVFHNKYTRKSSVSKCTNFDWKMHNATLTATECLNSKFDAEKLSFCHYTERELRKCLDKPKLLLDQCMPSKSKGLPDLVFEMLFGLLDFICKAEGFRLIELTNPCITLTLSNFSQNTCIDELDAQAEKFMGPEMCLSKSQLCQLMRSFKTCLDSILKTYCTSPVTRDNFFKFYDVILVPCKNHDI